MSRPMRPWIRFAVLLVTGLLVIGMASSVLVAQQAQPPGGGASYRKLAPDVLQTVDPNRQLEESFSRHDTVELLAFDPNFDWARDESYRHDVWTLQLNFKPMRMIWVDIPNVDGFMKRTLVWYMVYSVTNKKIEEKTCSLVFNPTPADGGPGRFEQKVIVEGAGGQATQSPPQFGWMHPLEVEGGQYRVQFLNKPIRFIPRFLLESPDLKRPEPDRVIPIAIGDRQGPGIRSREDPNREFLTTAEICDKLIAPGETVWGVVTWNGSPDLRDPKAPQPLSHIDRFSITIQGLTNAYLRRDVAGAYTKGKRIGTGRTLVRKTLKLNFWRPGDEYQENEREIRYGIPGEVDYEWVYRYKDKTGRWSYLEQDPSGSWTSLHKQDWVWRYRVDNHDRWIHVYKGRPGEGDAPGDWIYWYQEYGDTFWRTKEKTTDGKPIYLFQDHEAGWVYVYRGQDGYWRTIENKDGKWQKTETVFGKTVTRLEKRLPTPMAPGPVGAR